MEGYRKGKIHRLLFIEQTHTVYFVIYRPIRNCSESITLGQGHSSHVSVEIVDNQSVMANLLSGRTSKQVSRLERCRCIWPLQSIQPDPISIIAYASRGVTALNFIELQGCLINNNPRNADDPRMKLFALAR